MSVESHVKKNTFRAEIKHVARYKMILVCWDCEILCILVCVFVLCQGFVFILFIILISSLINILVIC